MKIVHLGWGHPPEHLSCGPVVYVHQLALDQQLAGHAVTVVAATTRQTEVGAPAYHSWPETIDGVSYILIGNRAAEEHDRFHPEREGNDPIVLSALTSLFRSLEPDVVHVHNLVGLSFDALVAAKASGARVVVSLHNYFPLCSRDDLYFANVEPCEGSTVRSCSRCLRTGLDNSLYRGRTSRAVALLNECDELLAVSHKVADLYLAHGVTRERIRVEHIASMTAARLWISGGAARVLCAEDAASSAPLELVFFGSLIARKGLLFLLQAFGAMRCGTARLTVLGTAPPDFAADVASLVSMLPDDTKGRIIFAGPYNHAALEHILPTMGAAVITPLWEDNGPQTVIEAHAAGLPVVGTRRGGVIDFVSHDKDGLLVDDQNVAALASALDQIAGTYGELERLRSGIVPPRTMIEHRLALDAVYQVQPTVRASCTVVLALHDDALAGLASLRAIAEVVSEGGRLEVVVVDDGSSDATPHLLDSLVGEVRVVSMPYPVGRRRTTAVAAALATSDHLVIVPAGRELPRDVEKTVAQMSGHEDWRAFGEDRFAERPFVVLRRDAVLGHRVPEQCWALLGASSVPLVL